MNEGSPTPFSAIINLIRTALVERQGVVQEDDEGVPTVAAAPPIRLENPDPDPELTSKVIKMVDAAGD